MIDLTPLDVRKKRGDFRRILRGYDPEEVDTFMDLVAERMEELVRENLALTDKVESLGSQLGALEGREKAVQEALVSAQKLREEVGDQSRRDAVVMKEQAARAAELMKAKAEAEISRRIGEAEVLVRERQRALEDLERSRLKFLKSFRGLLERELDAVEVEETRRPLDDVPLELEFRGWMPDGIGEEDPGEEDLGEGDSGQEMEDVAGEPRDVAGEWGVGPDESEIPADEPETLADGPEIFADEPGVQPAEASDPESPEAPLKQFGEEEEGAEGFVTQIMDVPPAPALETQGPDGWDPESDGGSNRDSEGGSDPASDVDSGPGAITQEVEDDDPASDEPRWLFSLLKREEEREG